MEKITVTMCVCVFFFLFLSSRGTIYRQSSVSRVRGSLHPPPPVDSRRYVSIFWRRVSRPSSVRWNLFGGGGTVKEKAAAGRPVELFSLPTRRYCQRLTNICACLNLHIDRNWTTWIFISGEPIWIFFRYSLPGFEMENREKSKWSICWIPNVFKLFIRIPVDDNNCVIDGFPTKISVLDKTRYPIHDIGLLFITQ